jgi:hypothetical protein
MDSDTNVIPVTTPRELARQLEDRFAGWFSPPVEFRDEITLSLLDPERMAEVCSVAKAELGFDMLLDITSVDNYGDEPRWTIVYELYGIGHRCHLRLKTATLHGEKMVLNMGPSHPATHGVLRLVLELDGEVITRVTPEIGYLHRGDEKIAENMTYTQFIPYTDRLDYLAPLANNVAYALAVEKLLGIDRQLPRCQYIRVICCELARISSHLLGLGSYAMDVGAMTVFLHTFTEREKVYNLCESLTGARFTTSYTRIGGLSRDLPPGWTDSMPAVLPRSPGRDRGSGSVVDPEPDLGGSHRGCGVIDARRRSIMG